MGSKLFPRPNPFEKWLIFLESIFKIFIVILLITYQKKLKEKVKSAGFYGLK